MLNFRVWKGKFYQKTNIYCSSAPGSGDHEPHACLKTETDVWATKSSVRKGNLGGKRKCQRRFWNKGHKSTGDLELGSSLAYSPTRAAELWFYNVVVSYGPPLWSSGQSSWLQIRRPGFDSRHYQKKSSGFGTGSTQPREYNWGPTW
jgi:hypothetical protein